MPPDHPSGSGHIGFASHRYAVLMAMITGAFRGKWEWTLEELRRATRPLFDNGEHLKSMFANWTDLIKNDRFVLSQKLRAVNAEGAARR